MKFNDLIAGMKRFGSNEEDICFSELGVSINKIKDNVIIAPWWEPDTLPTLGESELISEHAASVKVWNINNDGIEITYIKTGIGACVFSNVLLALGLTNCKRIIFIGSVGSLNKEMKIGDIVIPEFSICGDGVSRYIASDDMYKDVFGEKVYPNNQMLECAKRKTDYICRENNITWHIGKVFSVDTIFAQFAHIDTILETGCNAIEMETAVAFRISKLINIPLVALLNVSDNVISNKSLVSGRTEEENKYRKYVRREIFPEIIISMIKEFGNYNDL